MAVLVDKTGLQEYTDLATDKYKDIFELKNSKPAYFDAQRVAIVDNPSIILDDDIFDSWETLDYTSSGPFNSYRSDLNKVIITDPINVLGSNLFATSSAAAVTAIHLSKSITNIQSGCFNNFSNLTTIYYEGTEQEWDALCADGISQDNQSDFLQVAGISTGTKPKNVKYNSILYPNIITQPISTTTPAEGSNSVTFSVEVDGENNPYDASTSPYLYLWQYSEDGCTWNNSTATSKNTPNLTFNNTPSSGKPEGRYTGRMYRCIVKFNNINGTNNNEFPTGVDINTISSSTESTVISSAAIVLPIESININPEDAAGWRLTSNTLILSDDFIGIIDSDYPWYTYKDQIYHIIIDENVSYIYPNSFKDYANLESVSINKSILEIDDNAFSGCIKLKKLSYNGTYLEWNTISIHNGNEYLSSIYTNTELNPYSHKGYIALNRVWTVVPCGKKGYVDSGVEYYFADNFIDGVISYSKNQLVLMKANMSFAAAQCMAKTPGGFILLGVLDKKPPEDFHCIMEVSNLGIPLYNRTKVITRKTINENTIVDLNHCNGCCYDTENQMIYVVSAASIIGISYATLEITEKYEYEGSVHLTSIAYDKKTKKFYGKSGIRLYSVTLNRTTYKINLTFITNMDISTYHEDDLVAGQDIAAYNDIMYCFINQDNQIITVDANAKKTLCSIPLGSGNSDINYGEVESGDFSDGGQLYIMGANWLQNYSTSDLYSFVLDRLNSASIFKTNIGGVATPSAQYGQGMAGVMSVYVNNSYYRPLPVSRLPQSSFSSVTDACRRIMYRSNNGWGYTYELILGNYRAFDYTNELILLCNTSCDVNLNNFSIKRCDFKGSRISLTSGRTTTCIISNNSIVRLSNITIDSLTITNSTLIIGENVTISNITNTNSLILNISQ